MAEQQCNSEIFANGLEKNKKHNQRFLRIAFISYEFPPDTGKGGIGTYTSQVAKAMAVFGWDVHVFAGSHERTESVYSENYFVHRVRCKDPADFAYNVVKGFAAQHDLVKFDLAESPEINGNAWEIKKKYPQLPLVVRLHAPNVLVEGLKKKYIPFLSKMRFVLGSVRRMKFDLGYWRPYDKSIDADYRYIQLADFITGPSGAMKEWAITNWQIPPKKIIVLPNIFSPSNALLNIPFIEEPKYKRVVFFGRLNVLKGLVNTSKAMKKILKQYPGWQFRVIGDDGPGPANGTGMRNWMKQHLRSVISQVEFMDGLDYDKLPHAIEEGEIVLLPSLFESFSYTCAEAMAAGKCVIGSNSGGMADLIQNNKSGILVNPGNYSEIYFALKKLIQNDSFRHQLSIEARKRIVKDFNAKESAIQFADFYKKIPAKEFAKN